MKFSKLYCLLGDEHRTLIVPSLLILFFFINNISRLSALFNVAVIIVCFPTSMGKSFQECTIKSH